MLSTFTTILATAEGGEEEGGSFLVQPDVGLMLWTLLVFGGALFILAKTAFPRIAEALDKRQRMIEDSIDTANRTKTEAEDLLEEYRERLKEARVQAEEIVTKARRSAEETDREATEAGRQRREELTKQAERDIEGAKRRAMQEIRREVADLTIAATEKVTRRTLSADDQQKLVEEALGELDFSTLAGAGTGGDGTAANGAAS